MLAETAKTEVQAYMTERNHPLGSAYHTRLPASRWSVFVAWRNTRRARFFGQRSALRQPVEAAAPQRTTVKKRKSAPSHSAPSAIQHEAPNQSSPLDVPREDSPKRPGSLTDHEEERR